MSKCPPPPHDHIHTPVTPPPQQNMRRTLTAHRPLGAMDRGHPSDGRTLQTMMLFTVPTGAKVHEIPCSGESTPCSHEKIPCSVPNRKRCATHSTRYGNRRRKPPKPAEIRKIPCYFPCSQGIPRAACSSRQGRSQSWGSAVLGERGLGGARSWGSAGAWVRPAVPGRRDLLARPSQPPPTMR